MYVLYYMCNKLLWLVLQLLPPWYCALGQVLFPLKYTSTPLDRDKWGIFLPHYLIPWECQNDASRPVDNRGDMAGWSRTRVQGALALDTQRAWACPRSHTVPGDDVMSHAPAPQKKIVFSQQFVVSRAWPAPPSTKGPNARTAVGVLYPGPLLDNRCALLRWISVCGVSLFRKT